MTFKQKLERDIGRPMSWGEVVGKSLGNILWATAAWAGRTSVVVVALKLWGVL